MMCSWLLADRMGRRFRRGGPAGRCPRRPGSGRSAPAGRGRAAATASSRRWRASGGRYSDSWRPSPQATASPARAAFWAVTRPGGVQSRLDADQRRERAVGVHRNPPLAAPGPPRGGPGQVPGLLQPEGHVRGRGAGQEQQPVPRRQMLPLADHQAQDRARQLRPGRGSRRRPRSGRARGGCCPTASARPAARQPGQGPTARGCRCGLPVIS